MSWWDRVHRRATPVVADRWLSIWCVDASREARQQRDCCTIAKASRCRLVFHRIFQPAPDEPLDFEAVHRGTRCSSCATALNAQGAVRSVSNGGECAAPCAEGIQIEEFPQSVPNLTEACQNLFELIRAAPGGLSKRRHRLGDLPAVAVETSRGWRIAKEKQSHKIDVVIALAMSALASVRSPGESNYDSQYLGWSDTTP